MIRTTLSDTFGNARTVLAVAAIIGLIQLVLVLRRRRARDPGERLYHELCTRLTRAGITRTPDEGPTALAQRVKAIHMPAARQQAALDFLAAYSAYRYARGKNGPAQAEILKKYLNEFR